MRAGQRIRPLWEAVQPRFLAQELMQGTGQFWVTPRDAEILAMLLEHSFLGRRHLPFEGGARSARERMRKLYEHGLVARVRERPDTGTASMHVYGLTRLGFEVLLLDGNPVAVAAENGWEPPYTTFGTRNNVVHQMAVADLCTLVVREAGSVGGLVDWRGSKRLVQRIHPMAVGGQRLEVSPDAALVFDTGDVALVEHDRSLRPGDVNDRMTKYKRYFEARAWEATYAREPKVLFSVDVLGNTQGYSESVYTLAKEVAGRMLLFPAMFIREDTWRAGRLDVETINRDKATPLVDVLGLRRSRRANSAHVPDASVTGV